MQQYHKHKFSMRLLWLIYFQFNLFDIHTSSVKFCCAIVHNKFILSVWVITWWGNVKGLVCVWCQWEMLYAFTGWMNDEMARILSIQPFCLFLWFFTLRSTLSFESRTNGIPLSLTWAKYLIWNCPSINLDQTIHHFKETFNV
jgi:hypothetical protein